MTTRQTRVLYRILAAAALLLLAGFLPVTGWLRFCVYMLPYLVIGYDILLDAVRGILNRQLFDENFLMAVATVGAIVLAVTGSGDYTEAIAVMLFYQIGELFQSIAVGKSRRSITQLMDIRPDYANLEQDGCLIQTDPDEIPTGTVIVVQPGERIPLDGIVTEGTSSLNTSTLTGESLPRDVAAGDEVISGCINLSGVLRIRTTKEFGDSTVSRILDLVENASSRKSRSERFISRFAHWYTPVVCCSALALAVLPPLIRMFALGLPADWSSWLYRALTFLVISCPCALVISIPLTFFAGIGGAGGAGILIKGSNFLEQLAKTDTVVLDKTGTLTCGTFEVRSIVSRTIPQTQLLEYAALAESASPHPISRSLRRAYGMDIDRSRVSDLREYSGEGVQAQVDDKTTAVGSDRLMQRLGISFEPCTEPGTIIHVAVDGVWQGYILISDVIKPNARAAIAALRAAGVSRTVILTGDTEAVARQTAAELGIDEVHSRLLPADKVERMEALLAQKKAGSTLVYAGDGVNDAPVLTRADIGIAMGALGSDAAIEAADVVLMDDDPAKIAKTIRIARKCMGIVLQNILFALGVKLLCLILGALGIANMWLAIFADVGVMVIAVVNAIRALFVKKL